MDNNLDLKKIGEAYYKSLGNVQQTAAKLGVDYAIIRQALSTEEGRKVRANADSDLVEMVRAKAMQLAIQGNEKMIRLILEENAAKRAALGDRFGELPKIEISVIDKRAAE